MNRLNFSVLRGLQRYIAKVPMFYDERQVRATHAPTDPGDPAAGRAALAALSDLCRRAQADVAKEVPVMEQVFPNAGDALNKLVQRLFAQRIQVGQPPDCATLQAACAPVMLTGTLPGSWCVAARQILSRGSFHRNKPAECRSVVH